MSEIVRKIVSSHVDLLLVLLSASYRVSPAPKLLLPTCYYF